MLRLLTLGILALLAGCTESSGEPVRNGPEAPALPAAYVAGTESRVITSTTTGRTYQISVARPRSYDSSRAHYPVLYVLDANGLFGTVVEAARLGEIDGSIPELIVVGVGYPVGYYFDAIGLRVRDLTPTADPSLADGFARDAPHLPSPDGSGGAPAFLDFFRTELFPAIDAEYRTQPADRALFGHSLGGLFAFYSLLAGGDTFQRFVIGSPAFWWGGNYSFAQEEAFAESGGAIQGRVFMALGGLEDDRPAFGIPMRTRSNFLEMTARLESRRYAGLALVSHIFEGESHNSVVGALVGRGLRFVYLQ